MKSKELASQTARRRRTAAISVYVAELMQLDDLKVFGTPDTPVPPGWTVVTRASSTLLALSRREGGLKHRFGVLESDGVVFGVMFIRGVDELHVLVLDVSAPEVRELLAESERNGGMKILLVGDARDMRLMVPHTASDFRTLMLTARTSKTVNTSSFVRHLGDVMRHATSEEVIKLLGMTPDKLTEIQVSCLVTPQRVAEVERFILGGLTH